MEIQRSDAIELLTIIDLALLRKETKEELLEDYYQDKEDLEIEEELLNPENYSIYKGSIKSSYYGLANSYIKSKLIERVGSINKLEIIGEEEVLNVCGCCFYKTLTTINEYEICSVCFWENDGSYSLGNVDEYSDVNKMSIKEGRRNFIKIGVHSVEFEEYLNKDRLKKYLKS